MVLIYNKRGQLTNFEKEIILDLNAKDLSATIAKIKNVVENSLFQTNRFVASCKDKYLVKTHILKF